MKIPGLLFDASAEGLPWKSTHVAGIEWLPLHVEDAPRAPRRKGERAGSTVLIRMAPGAGYGEHLHLGSEDVLVLSGGYRDELGEYHSGEHVHYPPGSRHAPVALGDPNQEPSTKNPSCVLFAVASGGIELLGRDES